MNEIPRLRTDTYFRVAVLTALVCSVAAAIYVAADVEPSTFIVSCFTFAPGLTVILWLQRDAARTGVASVTDLGFFLWVAWPVVIPWYSWKTRGRSGWRLTILLFALIGSAFITALVAAALLAAVR